MTIHAPKPIKRTLLTTAFALATLLAAFVWPTAMTRPLNARGANALVVVWYGYADLMADGLHGEYPRAGGDRSLRLSPALVKGYQLPKLWYRHDRPNGSLRVQIPLFIPLAALLAWTACGWNNHRRRRAGQECQTCGYPLLGLNPPTCPECGPAA